MRQLLRGLAVGAAVIVAAVAIPDAASAADYFGDGATVYLQQENGLPSPLCMGVAGGDVSDGKQIVMWDCGSADQRWTLPQDSVDWPEHSLLNVNSGLLIAPYTYGSRGSWVYQWPNDPAGNDSIPSRFYAAPNL